MIPAPTARLRSRETCGGEPVGDRGLTWQPVGEPQVGAKVLGLRA